MGTPTLTAWAVRSREEHVVHEVNVEFDVSGMPVYSGDKLCTKKPITPEVVKVMYQRRACSGPYTGHATVYGSQSGSLMRGWANFYASARERGEWPEWLVALVDANQPEADSQVQS